jgi:hypothetical protein
MESPDEILQLPGRTPRARHRQHYSVIASKEFRQLDRIIKEFLRVFFCDGSSSIFLGKLTSLRLLTCTPSRPRYLKRPSSIFEHRRERRIVKHAQVEVKL